MRRQNALEITFSTIAALGCVFLTGCSEGSTATNEAPTYVRDIEPLVQDRCVNCHTAGGIGPFALETYDQVQAAKDAIKAAVVSRTMPPWQAADGCNDYRGDFSLSDEQINLIERWVDADGPMGDPNDSPIAVTHDSIELSRVDHELTLPTEYTPQLFPDDYRCFFVDWPATETLYATGFGVQPGNTAIVHHAIGYVVRPENIATFQALDDADSAPGWPCFGGPGASTSGPPAATWLGGWAPGITGNDFPEGTGIEIPVGAKIVVQMHYNSMKMDPAPDRTKILLRTERTVEKRAAILPYTNFQWVFSGKMNIPAHTQGVVHNYASDPTLVANLATDGVIAAGKPLTLYSVGFHMHTLGKRITGHMLRADGTDECLAEIPRWNFHWQRSYNFAKPKLLNPGDRLELECEWDNTSATDVNWGEGTSDEMCLAPYYVTE